MEISPDVLLEIKGFVTSASSRSLPPSPFTESLELVQPVEVPIDPANPTSKKRKRWPAVKLPENLSVTQTPLYKPPDPNLSFGEPGSSTEQQPGSVLGKLSPINQRGDERELQRPLAIPSRSGEAAGAEEAKIPARADSQRAGVMGPPQKEASGRSAKAPPSDPPRSQSPP